MIEAKETVVGSLGATKQSLKGSTNVSSTYTSEYILPKASETTLGGIKVGDNLNIEEDGTLNATGVTSYNELTDTPTKLSQFENDLDIVANETDPTVPDWVKEITEEQIHNWNVGTMIKLSGSVEIDDLAQGVYISDSDNTMLYLGENYDENGYVRKGSLIVVSWVKENRKSVTVIGYQGGFYRMMCTPATRQIGYDYWITENNLEYYLPTNLSDLENDVGYLTEHQDISHLATKEELHTHNNKEVLDNITQEDIDSWNNGTGGTGGNVDLSDYAKKSELPTKTSQLTNDSGYINAIPNEYITESELDAKGYLTEHQDLTNYAKTTDIPKKVSELENDSKYLTSIPLEYVTETELSEKSYATESFVTNKIAEAELSGSDVDLSGLATKDELNNKVDKVIGKSLIADSEINRLAGLNNYDDTEIKNTLKTKADTSAIPTKVSQLSNDKGYLTSIPSEYITETELSNKGYLTSIPTSYKTKTENDKLYQAIGDYATTSDIPTKTSQLTNDSNFITSIPSEYVTETELNGKGYLTSVPSTYKTKSENDALYQVKGNYLTSIPSEYITESELNSKGYLTSVPTASANQLGLIKVGANLSISADGTLNASASGGSGGDATSVDGYSFWSGTLSEYEQLSTKDNKTVYMIVEEV